MTEDDGEMTIGDLEEALVGIGCYERYDEIYGEPPPRWRFFAHRRYFREMGVFIMGWMEYYAFQMDINNKVWKKEPPRDPGYYVTPDVSVNEHGIKEIHIDMGGKKNVSFDPPIILEKGEPYRMGVSGSGTYTPYGMVIQDRPDTDNKTPDQRVSPEEE